VPFIYFDVNVACIIDRIRRPCDVSSVVSMIMHAHNQENDRRQQLDERPETSI